MSRAKGWMLAVPLAGVAILAGLVVARRGERLRSPERPPAAAPAPIAPPGPAPAPPAIVAPTPQEPAGAGRTNRGAEIVQAAKAMEVRALRDVRAILKSRGGLAALEHVRARVDEGAKSLEDRFHAASLVRLIPFIAREDPGSTAAALILEQDLLKRPASDEFVRFQAIAGLSGLSSSGLSVAEVVGSAAPPTIHFKVDGETEDAETPCEASLLDAARKAGGIGELLLGTLAADGSPEVRRIGCAALAAFPSPQAVEALGRLVRSDEDDAVRRECLSSLARLDPKGFVVVAGEVGVRDEDPAVRAAAFALLPATVPYDAEVSKLMARATVSSEFGPIRPAVVAAALDYLRAGQGGELRPPLLSLLLRDAPDAQLVAVFAEKTVEGGLSEFLPVFRAVEPTLAPDAPAKERLADAIRKLENVPHYAAIAEKIRGASTELRGLFAELDRADTPPQRRDAITSQINALCEDLAKLRRDYEKK